MTRRERNQPGARYTPLLTRARAAEQCALQNLSQARIRHRQEQEKLSQLESYPHSQASNQASSAARLMNRNAFLSRLRHAIQTQQQQLNKLEQQIKQAHKQWVHANRDTRRYEQLIANEELRARLHAARLEQKELDEIATRAHQRMPHRV